MVPYSKGLSESFRNICVKAGEHVHFRGANTAKELLVVPKNKDNIIQKGGVIYRYRCDQPGCTMEYRREVDRNFGERYKEHIRPPLLSSVTSKPLDITSHWTTAQQWAGNHRASLESSKKQC